MAYVLALTMSNALIRLPVDYFAVVGAAVTPLGGVMSKVGRCVWMHHVE